MPDDTKKVVVAENRTAPYHERVEYVPLCGRKEYFLRASPDSRALSIDLKIHHPNAIMIILRLTPSIKNLPNSNKQLTVVERLSDIVIGTGLETGNHLVVAIVRTHHDDRGLSARDSLSLSGG